MNWKKRVQAEDGTSLVLVLAFLGGFALLITALLGQSDVNLKWTTISKFQDKRTYAADAGVEYGMQRARMDATWCPDTTQTNLTASSTPSPLPTAGTMKIVPPGSPITAPSMTVNGVDTDVYCTTEKGQAAGIFGWAIITHDTSNQSISDGSSASKTVVGSIFNGGGWSLSNPLIVKSGYVYEKRSSCAGAAPPAQLTVQPNPPFNWSCTNAVVPDPAHVLPAIPTTAGSITPIPGTKNSVLCRQMSPGLYAGPASIDFSADTYMASGVYYFLNVGTIALANVNVVGGSSSTQAAQAATLDPKCSKNAPNNGEGVEIILGGNSAIQVNNNASMELFSRISSGSESQGISIYQIPQTGAPAGWIPGPNDPTTLFLDVSGNPGTQFVSHGAIYGPDGSATVWNANSSVSALQAGINVYRVKLKAPTIAGGSQQISNTSVTPGQRQMIITAIADPKGVNGKSMTSRAVIEIDNLVTAPFTQARVAKARSWWTNNP